MKLTRHFFISDDLDDLERLEDDLERAGLVTPQIHVLTLDDSGAEDRHHLHTVGSIMKQDLVRSTIRGAVIGVVAAIIILVVAYAAGWTATPAGWVPPVFLAIVLLGFFTWEGGLRGAESPHVHLQRFRTALENGRHVFFVDLEPRQTEILNEVAAKHSTIESAGTARGSPHWIVFWQYRVKRFFTETFP